MSLSLSLNFDQTASQQLLYVMDMIGVIACAVAGTLLAKQKNMDIAGCLLVAAVNAVGGGSLRDVLLDRHPLFWMADMNYLLVVFVVSMLVQVFVYKVKRIEGVLRLFDAIGLAAFTLIGLKIGLAAEQPWVIAAIMGMITAVVGGLTRDMICNEVPLVLRREIYITAALFGCIVHYLLTTLSIADWAVDVATLIAILAARLLAMRFDWHLPNISLSSK